MCNPEEYIEVDWAPVTPQEPKFRRPELLQHPPIPRGLHYFNPRTLMGEEWWDIKRRQAYAENDYCCWACGVHQTEAYKHQWLEGHECYEYNVKDGIVTLVEIVALCWACHAYIHEGHLAAMCMSRKITRAEENWVRRHGAQVLREAGLLRSWAVPGADDVEQWTLKVDDKEFTK